MTRVFIEPTAKSRRKYVAITLGISALALLADVAGWWDDAGRYLESLPLCTQAAVVSVVLGGLLVLVAAMGICSVVIAYRVLRVGQFPLPGVTVLTRTELLVGTAAKQRAVVILAVAMFQLAVPVWALPRLVVHTPFFRYLGQCVA